MFKCYQMSVFPEVSKDTDYNGYVDDDEFLRNVFPDEFLRSSSDFKR